MNFEDLIGFIISIAAFVFLIIRSALKKNQTTDEEEEEATPPPPYIPPIPGVLQKKRTKLVKESKRFLDDPYSGSSVVSSHYTNIKESAPYEVIGKDLPSRAHQIVAQLKSKKDIVILHEIIGPPKGFR